MFVHDLTTGQTVRASVDSSGTQGNGTSWDPDISEDGRYVIFMSGSSNLVPGDSQRPGRYLSLHDLLTNQTTRV